MDFLYLSKDESAKGDFQGSEIKDPIIEGKNASVLWTLNAFEHLPEV